MRPVRRLVCSRSKERESAHSDAVTNGPSNAIPPKGYGAVTLTTAPKAWRYVVIID